MEAEQSHAGRGGANQSLTIQYINKSLLGSKKGDRFQKVVIGTNKEDESIECEEVGNAQKLKSCQIPHR